MIEEPTVTPASAPFDGVKVTHPAFAAIRAARITGQTSLFGSNVGHSGFVRVEISAAESNDSGYNEHLYGFAGRYICVDMSESQWVAFISRMNIGSGVACTLRHYRDGDRLIQVPELPPAKSQGRDRRHGQGDCHPAWP